MVQRKKRLNSARAYVTLIFAFLARISGAALAQDLPTNDIVRFESPPNFSSDPRVYDFEVLKSSSPESRSRDRMARGNVYRP